MAGALAVPAEAMRGRHSFGDDHLDASRDLPDRGPAQEVIGERIHLADTWTFITAACFLVWTALVFLALSASGA